MALQAASFGRRFQNLSFTAFFFTGFPLLSLAENSAFYKFITYNSHSLSHEFRRKNFQKTLSQLHQSIHQRYYSPH